MNVIVKAPTESISPISMIGISMVVAIFNMSSVATIKVLVVRIDKDVEDAV